VASWQNSALDRIEAAALAHGAIRVQPFGSVAAGTLDEWSDLDALVIAPDDRVAEFWPDHQWLPAFDAEVVATKHWRFRSDVAGVIQLLLADGRRVDVMVVEESLADERIRLLADLRPVVDASTVDTIANTMVFDALDAVHRAARGERILSTQLAFGLVGYCLDLSSAIRDLETGSCVHRFPANADELVDLLPAIPAAPGPADILQVVTAALDCFEDLIGRGPFHPPFPRTAIDNLIRRAERG